ncbi:MAG: phosphotransferase [Rhodospirillales bacterium]|nr:phosphotransferase [Rhodospirillales bacterium]
MKVLLIDAEQEPENELAGAIRAIDGLELSTATSLEDAKREINSDFFDAFILDLNLRADDGLGGAGGPNGLGVLAFLEDTVPLMPVLLLADEIPDCLSMDRFLCLSHQLDVLGDGRVTPTIRVFSKADFLAITDLLSEYCNSIADIDAVEINTGPDGVILDAQQRRILKRFAMRFKGASCRVLPAPGGLSGSNALELRVTDDAGAQRIHAVGKLDKIDTVDRESKNFAHEVTRLSPDSYAPQVCVVKGGAYGSAGVFYRLLSSDFRPLFAVLLDNPGLAAEAVTQLQELLKPWREGVPHSRQTIREIRQRLVNEDELSDILAKASRDWEVSLDWIYDLESRTVMVNIACIHRDLHGANVFVREDGKPIMIDFGDVGDGAVAIDPITLELSMFAHPSISKSIKWYPEMDTYAWADLDNYVSDSPYGEFIKNCRKWSYEVAGGDLAVYASAYSYLLQQLRYPDVDKELIFSLLYSVRDSILGAH